MRIVTFNVNSVRARMDSVLFCIEKHQPDILGLQEIKCQDADFPKEAFESKGYFSLVHGQKTHHGVALLTKKQPKNFQLGRPWAQGQARLISAEFEGEKNGPAFHLFNVYFPNGEERAHPLKFPYKMEFYKNLSQEIQQSEKYKQPLVVMGDFNIAPEDIDIGIGEANRKRWLQTGKCSFLPEEREAIQQLFQLGLKDPYRKIYPNDHQKFSWFDYRSAGFEDNPKRGLRIDYALMSSSLFERCFRVEIDYEIRAWNKPSDHCPIIYDF